MLRKKACVVHLLDGRIEGCPHDREGCDLERKKKKKIQRQVVDSKNQKMKLRPFILDFLLYRPQDKGNEPHHLRVGVDETRSVTASISFRSFEQQSCRKEGRWVYLKINR